MLQALVQISVLDKVHFRDLWVHFAVVVDEFQNGQLLRVLVPGLCVVIHFSTYSKKIVRQKWGHDYHYC